MLSNASPSAEVTNFSTVCDTVDIPGNMDDQPGPHDDPVGLQNDEGQPGDPKNIIETRMESPKSPLEPFPLPALPQAPVTPSPEPLSDSMAHGEFDILILP